MSPPNAHAFTTVRARAEHPGWNLRDDEKSQATHIKDEPKDMYQRPTTGRNTRLGRKVEKPRDPKSGGPSGQKDRARHDKRHANK